MKKKLGLITITIMNIAYFGIQFGFALQIANISGIYECLGAKSSAIPVLWLASPLSGMLVQPVIGIWSDRTWCRFGRRKPYIFTGALVSSISLFFMPSCRTLWTIICLIWIFNCAINVSLGTIRALVADNMSDEQMTLGFSIQGILIALGAILASCMPWVLINLFGFSHIDVVKSIPEAIQYSFKIGSIVLITTVAVSVIFGKEEPPENMEEFLRSSKRVNIFKDLFEDLISMPKIMRELAWSQFFAWMGMFAMFMYFPIAVANNIFHSKHGLIAYNKGIEWAGICFGIYSVVQFFFSFIIPWSCKKFSDKSVYFVTMLLGGIGLVCVYFLQSQYGIIWSMISVGVMYAGVSIIPFAILGKILPKNKIGVYMGVFNIFITLPGILVSILLGPVVHYIFSDNRLSGVIFAGVCMLIASIFILKINVSKNRT